MSDHPVELWRSRTGWDRDQEYCDLLSEWLREHDLDPAQICPAIVVIREGGRNWLHVSEYQRGEDGEKRVVDRALMTAVSSPRVLPLRGMPPVPSVCLDRLAGCCSEGGR